MSIHPRRSFAENITLCGDITRHMRDNGLSPSDEETNHTQAILTSDDMDILTGEKTYDKRQHERNARYRMRERIKSGIYDLAFLYENRLREDDLGQIFSDLMEDEQERLERGCAFIFRGVDYFQSEIKEEETSIREFEKFLEKAIHQAVLWKYQNQIFTVNVDLNVISRSGDYDEVRSRLLREEGTYRDLEYLMENDEMVPLLREMGEGQTITVTPHFGDDRGGEEFTLDDLISLGIDGVRKRLEG